MKCPECGDDIAAHDDDGCWVELENGDLCPCCLTAGEVALKLLEAKNEHTA